MPFISANWLEEMPKRRRNHFPKKVTIHSLPTRTDWAKRNEVVLSVVVTKKDEKCQVLYLSKADIATVLPALARYANASDIESVLMSLSSAYEDADVLRLFEKILSARKI